MGRGRKPLRDELTQANVINVSWTTIDRALKSSKVSQKQKLMISLEVVKKTCPKEINLKTDALNTTVYNINNQVQRDYQESRQPSLVLDPRDGLDKG